MEGGGSGLGLGLGFGGVERVRLLLLEDDDIGRSCSGVSGTNAEVKEVKK